jgi:hypothetical protein
VALLSAFAAQSTAHYLTAHPGNSGVVTQRIAATDGFTLAFAISAGIFVGAAILCGALIRKHPSQPAGSRSDSAAEVENSTLV